jgi:DNA primase
MDVATAEGRARAATAALVVIAQHPDELVRDQYLMDLADRLRLPSDQVRERMTAVRRGDVVAAPTNGTTGGGTPRSMAASLSHDSPEREALRLALSRPDEVAPSLHEVLFADPVCADAYHHLVTAQWKVAHVDGADPDVVALVQRLAVEETASEPAEVVERLVEAAGQRELALLGAEARAADDDRALEVASLVGWLKPQLEALRDPRTASPVAPVVLDWLISRHGAR